MLTDPQWVRKALPLCLIGDCGTGKSHLLIGIGTAMVEAGLHVRYVTTAALVNELVEAAGDKQLSRLISRYSKIDLLCLDEFGYVNLDKRGANLLFQIFTERGGAPRHGDRLKFPVQRMEEDLHRSAAVSGRGRPDHVPGHVHQHRHRFLPAGRHRGQAAPGMTTPAGGRAPGPVLDEQAVQSLAGVLSDLAGFFDGCSGPVADAMNDHFNDLAAADWLPIVLDEHARVLKAALRGEVLADSGGLGQHRAELHGEIGIQAV
jgi:hypothetical protein